MSGRQICLRLDLVDDLVLSMRAATTGGHRSLGYVPGAALLGAMAGRLYRELDARGLAFAAFHSGRLRYGNGLPLDGDGRIGWPVPLQLHRRKGAAGTDLGDGQAEVLVLPDPEAPEPDAAAGQKVQLRDGFVTGDLRVIEPAMHYAMKTAIDPLRGRAQNEQLFGYESLAAGQSFVAEIACDADATAVEAFDVIVDSLRRDPMLRLGRSRSAEFGRVEAHLLADVRVDPPSLGAGSGSLRLWALSDLCLVDADGEPALAPAAFGFPGANIDWQRTFVRSRTYAPFNAHWGRSGIERSVVVQGSVITLTGAGLDDPAARTALAGGVGLHRECGLGRVAADPWILAELHPRKAEPVRVALRAVAAAQPDRASPLVRWLEQKCRAADGAADTDARVAENLKELADICRRAALWATATEDAVVGPGPAQWNAVRDVAERFGENPGELSDRLFGRKGIAREGDDDWEARYDVDQPGRPSATFRGWLQGLVKELSGRTGGLQRRLPEIARRAADQARLRGRER